MRTDMALSSDMVALLHELPTLPTIVYELAQVMSDPMSSTRDIERIMGMDPALTTKVLKLANSAYYAIPGGVSNLQRAIAYIGYDSVHQLVLSTSIISTLKVESLTPNFNLRQFWKHSIGVAMATEATAKFVGHKAPADLFTCGLIHDMGKIAMLAKAPDLFSEIIEYCREHAVSFYEAEQALGYPSHTALGSALAERWSLPLIFQASTAYHHSSETTGREHLSSELNAVVDIVYVSNLFIHALDFGHSGHNRVNGVSKSVLDRLQLKPERLKSLIGEIQRAVSSAETFLKIIEG